MLVCYRKHQSFITIFLLIWSYHSYLNLQCAKWNKQYGLKFWMASYLLCEQQFMSTGNILKIKSRNKTLKFTSLHKWSNKRWIRFKVLVTYQTRWICRWPTILSLQYRLTVNINHWNLDIIQKFVACGISTMRSAIQNIWTQHQEITQRWHWSLPK